MNARSLPGPRTSAGRLLPFLLAALAILGGCATERGVALPEFDDWRARLGVLTAIEQWSFSGRIGVSNAADGFNGRLRWRQDADRFEASVSGPLGAGAISITGDTRTVVIDEGDGNVLRMSDPEFELKLRYGWTIPVESLRYWALGIPDPGQPANMDFGEGGTLTRIAQSGWTVDIPQYREGGGQLMPRRITAVNGDSRVRLVIDNWVFY